MKTISKKDVEVIAITMDVEERQCLFILMHKDGTLNRMGSGELEATDLKMYIGKTNTPPITEVLEIIPEEAITQPVGRYLVEPLHGKKCKLSLLFQTGTEEGGIEVIYGSESEGPHWEICAAVEKAVELTEDWFQDFRKKSS